MPADQGEKQPPASTMSPGALPKMMSLYSQLLEGGEVPGEGGHAGFQIVQINDFTTVSNSCQRRQW